MTEVLQRFQVVTLCPVHDRPVYLIIDASSMEEAEQMVLGMTVSCPWGGVSEAHSFVVEKILSVMRYPWEPPVTVSTAVVPSVVTKEVITSTLGEHFYILSEKGETRFTEMKQAAERQVTLAPAQRRGGGTALTALILLGLVIPPAYLLYRRWKNRG